MNKDRLGSAVKVIPEECVAGYQWVLNANFSKEEWLLNIWKVAYVCAVSGIQIE